MSFFKKSILLSLLFALTACSHFGGNRYVASREKTYLSARSIAPLQIPPGLASGTIQEEYPIAYRNYPEAAKFPSLVPPGL